MKLTSAVKWFGKSALKKIREGLDKKTGGQHNGEECNPGYYAEAAASKRSLSADITVEGKVYNCKGVARMHPPRLGPPRHLPLTTVVASFARATECPPCPSNEYREGCQGKPPTRSKPEGVCVPCEKCAASQVRVNCGVDPTQDGPTAVEQGECVDCADLCPESEYSVQCDKQGESKTPEPEPYAFTTSGTGRIKGKEDCAECPSEGALPNQCNVSEAPEAYVCPWDTPSPADSTISNRRRMKVSDKTLISWFGSIDGSIDPVPINGILHGERSNGEFTAPGVSGSFQCQTDFEQSDSRQQQVTLRAGCKNYIRPAKAYRPKLTICKGVSGGEVDGASAPALYAQIMAAGECGPSDEKKLPEVYGKTTGKLLPGFGSYINAGHILAKALGGVSTVTGGKLDNLGNFFPQDANENQRGNWWKLEICLGLCLQHTPGKLKLDLEWRFKYTETSSLYPSKIEVFYEFQNGTKCVTNNFPIEPNVRLQVTRGKNNNAASCNGFFKDTVDLVEPSLDKFNAGTITAPNLCSAPCGPGTTTPCPPAPPSAPPSPSKKRKRVSPKKSSSKSTTRRRALEANTPTPPSASPPDFHLTDNVRAAFAGLPPSWRARAQQEAGVGRRLGETTDPDDENCIGSLEGGVSVASLNRAPNVCGSSRVSPPNRAPASRSSRRL